jgi:hypothetical protein
MARNVDQAGNFVSVQLIEQKPGIYDKCQADYQAGQNIFGLGKNFSRDEGVWILVKFFRNNISASA